MYEPSVMLCHDRAVFDRLKNYAWMAGASVNLDSGSARVLRDALDSSINLASGLTAVILDTDFPDGIEPCEAELQGIGAGLRVRGKGKVRWQLKSEGKFMMSKNGIFFELNKNDCVQIVLNAANHLHVALASNTADVVSDDLALVTCDTHDVHLPQRTKRLLQWHCRFKRLAGKGYIRGSVDALPHVICDSSRRLAHGSK